MNINSFEINTSKMSSTEVVRVFTVTGDVGAGFQILAIQNPSSSSAHTLYYDFVSKTFESGHNDLNNNLLVTLSSNIYRNNIIFPEGGGEYVLKLVTTNGTNSNIITRNISKDAALTTLTFQAATVNTSNYETFPTTTAVGGFTETGKADATWNIQNKINDTHGFGLVSNSNFFPLNFNLKANLISKGIDRAWFFQTTETVDGAITSSNKVKVDDLTDLVVGMEIRGVSSGSLSGIPRIKKINVADKTLEISSAQTFADGITLTFRAYGSKGIFKATGGLMFFGFVVITPKPLTKSVRANVSSSTNITLNNTLGIAGGNKVQYKGLGVNNSSSNSITQISTADADGTGGDGVIVSQLAQTLTAGAPLFFIGSHAEVDFEYTVKIASFPEADRTINFDIDQFLEVGVAS